MYENSPLSCLDTHDSPVNKYSLIPSTWVLTSVQYPSTHPSSVSGYTPSQWASAQFSPVSGYSPLCSVWYSPLSSVWVLASLQCLGTHLSAVSGTHLSPVFRYSPPSSVWVLTSLQCPGGDVYHFLSGLFQ